VHDKDKEVVWEAVEDGNDVGQSAFCLLNFQPVEDRVLILDNLIPFVFNVIENLMDVLADLRS
jgi:hypothetical protein